MHFFFGIGAFFTPIVVKFFLNSDFDISTTSNSFNCYNIEETVRYHHLFTQVNSKNYLSHDQYMLTEPPFILNDSITRENPLVPNILMTRTEFTSQIKYAFWILALIQLPAPIFLFIFMNRFDNLTESQPSNDDLTKKEEKKEAPGLSVGFFRSLLSDIPVLQMTLLVSILVFLFEGLQVNKTEFNLFSFTIDLV
jgi:hypothetical protein